MLVHPKDRLQTAEAILRGTCKNCPNYWGNSLKLDFQNTKQKLRNLLKKITPELTEKCVYF